jgi:MFS transporter, DHA1 family, solute carrier family 18 (vesicular amine transporter), member 1/2
MSLRRSRAVAAALVTLGTFTDLLAYSIAVPVLPDLTGRLGATPTTIGFLFASFGVTLLGVSIPMGAISDRVGRRVPLVIGMAILAGSTLIFAYATTLPGLFAARLMQGAADAITWGVGFALIADRYDAPERGRVMGLVMSGSNLGFMLGPSIGGWLYETGGPRLPFLLVTALAVVCLLGFLWLHLPRPAAAHEVVPFKTLVRVPAVASCAVVVVVVSATFSMFEPIVSLFLSTSLGQSPSRVGLVFGVAAVASAVLHPLYGRLADRYGGANLMLLGLVLAASVMPALARVETYRGAVTLFLVQAGLLSMVVTPSLAYMADASARAGGASFGVSYGLYNFAWGCGLLGGPAIGGVLYEDIGFTMLLSFWPLVLVGTAVWLAVGRRAGREQSVATVQPSKEIS